MNEKPTIYERVDAFTKRIVLMVEYLKEHRASRNIINQIERSGLSIGANLNEGRYAQSRADFVHKLNIALGESSETAFWLTKLHDGRYISDVQYDSMYKDINDIIHILRAIIKTTKQNGL